MPIITSDNIANWYYLEDLHTPRRFLIENFTTTRNQSVEQRKAIQGLPGTLIMNVGASDWNSTFSSNALIIKDGDLYYDIFDLLKEDLGHIKQFLLYQNEFLEDKNLLVTADIDIGSEVGITLTYTQKFDNIFNFKYVAQNNSTEDFVARTAKFYDTNFYLSKKLDSDEYFVFKVNSGNIKISVDYDTLYFVNSNSEFPFYSLQNYKISGSFKSYLPHNEIDSLILYNKNFNELIPSRANCSIAIGDRYLELGQANIQSNVTFSKTNEYLEIESNFVAYSRFYEEQ
jgi:hypothetical protein